VGCEYYLELIGCEMDGELTGEERTALTAHLETCEDCRRYAAALRAIHEGIAEEAQVPAHFAESVMAKLPKKKTNVIPFRRWGSLAAAAAVLVIALGSGVFAPKGKEAAMAAPMAPAAGDTPAEAAPTEMQRNETMMFSAPAPRAAAEEAKSVEEEAPAADCVEAEAAFDPVTEAALRYAEEKLPGHWEILEATDETILLRHESGEELTLTVNGSGEVSEK